MIAAVALLLAFGTASAAPPMADLINVTSDEALCLDGSRYAYYLSLDPSGDRSNWQIQIQGGGWCYDEMDCATRALTSLGSRNKWAPQIAAPNCMNTDAPCNSVMLHYCDGASFSGYRPEPWPVRCSPYNNASWPGENSTCGKGSPPLHFRGFANLQKSLDDLERMHGLSEAKDIVLTGGSAGGLSTFLHLDYVAGRFPHAYVTGAPWCGFFLDTPNAGSASAPGQQGVNYTYTKFMQYVFHMQNATVLSKECQDFFGDDAWKCIMAPHAAPFIQTPWFALQSRFDHWQLAEEKFLPCIQSEPYHPPFPFSPEQRANCSTPEQEVVESYGGLFMDEFERVVRSSNRNGAFLDACIIHGSTTSKIDGLNNNGAFQEWWKFTKAKPGSAPNPWRVMMCPDGKGGLSNRTGPCDTASVCVPWKQRIF